LDVRLHRCAPSECHYVDPFVCFLLRYVLSLHDCILLFSFNDAPPPEIYTLSLHDALPIYCALPLAGLIPAHAGPIPCCTSAQIRSEEHTSELQSRFDLVCRLLLEKKNKSPSVALAANSTITDCSFVHQEILPPTHPRLEVP